MAKKKSSFAKKAGMIARSQGLPVERAKAILAAGAQKAGKKALKANPKLKKVLKAQTGFYSKKK